MFAVEKLTPTDPQVTIIATWTMGLLLVCGIVLIAKNIIVEIMANRREQDAEDRNIWFDEIKSVLHRNYRQISIPDTSLEYYVCKLVFEEQDKPQLDINVLEAAGKPDDYDPRAIEQAVRRVNKKANQALGLKADLLLRRKEKTFLNEIDKLV